MSVSSIADNLTQTREFSWLFLKQKVISLGISIALPTELLGKLYWIGKDFKIYIMIDKNIVWIYFYGELYHVVKEMLNNSIKILFTHWFGLIRHLRLILQDFFR